MEKQKNARGIAIVTVMLTTLFLVMFSSVLLVYTLNQQQRTKSVVDHQLALKAAEAGIAYAMARAMTTAAWNGYGGAADGSGNYPPVNISTNDKTLDVYEHYVDSAGGCVEGKITAGERNSYFDFYFRKPTSDASMVYFRTNSEAGTIPDIVTLSHSAIGTAESEAYRSDGVDLFPIPNKIVPAGTVMIICRGRSGNITRFVEACFSLGGPSGQEASVAVGRGNTTISLRGTGDLNQNLKLRQISENGETPSLLRAAGSLQVDTSLGNYTLNNYLTLEGASGGRSGAGSPILPQNSSNPAFIYEQCLQDSPDKYIPTLTLEDLKSKSTANKPEDFPIKLKPGTYFITDNLENPNTPKVYYIPTDNPDHIDSWRTIDKNLKEIVKDSNYGRRKYENPIYDVTSTFFDPQLMEWDPALCKLTFKESVNIKKDATLENIIFASGGCHTVTYDHSVLGETTFTGGKDRITIQIGPTPEKNSEEKTKPVYLVNSNSNGGGIHVDGQLSGFGTVICEGDLTMEAQSQLDAKDSGISAYAGGTIEVLEMDSFPYIEQFPDGLPPELANSYNRGRRLFSKILERFTGSSDIDIPLDVFTPQEQALLELLNLVTTKSGDKYLVVKTDGPHDVAEFAEDNDRKYSVFEGGTLKANSQYLPSLKEIFLDGKLLNIIYGSNGNKNSNLNLKDTIFRGLIYTCGNFEADMPKHSFILDGGLVAYGGNFAGTPDATKTRGHINITARDVTCIYNSRYLSLLAYGSDPSSQLKYWTILNNW